MKTAVFYDLENIGLAGKAGELEQALTVLRQKIEASGLVREIVLQRAYISKTHSSLARLAPILEKHQIELVAVEPVLKAGSKKHNMVDFKMGIDVIATIAAKRSLATVAIASGDNDFGFLCQKIKDMGRKLLVISSFGTTGEAMLKLCDDWIDLRERTLTTNFIRQAITKRIAADDSPADFLQAFAAFLHAVEEDLLIRRYMASFGLPLNIFIEILHERISKFPKHGELGFANISGFMTVLLSGTNFECQGGIVKYNSSQQPLSQHRLLDNILCLPPGYTREKLFKYYDAVSGIERIGELLAYIEFMKRSGMLKGNELCGKRTFRATIRKHLRSITEKAGLVLDEAALADIDKKL